MVVGGRESDYSVCPRPLLQFLQFFQFMSDSLCQVTQVTSGYVRLRQFTSEGRDVELDNMSHVLRLFHGLLTIIGQSINIAFILLFDGPKNV